MTTEGVSVVGMLDDREADPLLATADGDMLADPSTELPGTELDLPWPLLNKLELARKPGLELLPNDGVGWGAELAGVAIRVGFTLFLVLVATVVVTRKLLGLKILPGFLSLSTGLMTGVKVFPGRLNEILLRVLVGFTPSSPFSSSASLSSSFSELRVRSSSISWKLDVGAMVEDTSGVSIVDAEMTSMSDSLD